MNSTNMKVLCATAGAGATGSGATGSGVTAGAAPVTTPPTPGAGSGSTQPAIKKVRLVVEITPKPNMHVYAPGQPDVIPVSLTLAASDAVASQPLRPATERGNRTRGSRLRCREWWLRPTERGNRDVRTTLGPWPSM